MEKKAYIFPEFTTIEAEADVITTSDIEAGVETTPVPDHGGSWETL